MIVESIIFFIINIYVFVRGWQALPNVTGLQTGYTLIYFLILGIVILSFYSKLKFTEEIAYAFRLIRRYYLFFLMFFFLAVIFADFIRIINYFSGIFPEWTTNNYQHIKNIYFLSVIFISIIVTITGYRQYASPRISELNLQIDNFNGYSGSLNILAISDMHLGIVIRKERLCDWVEIINNQNPDLILLVGDTFDHTFKSLDYREIIYELSSLTSKYGVYAVLGNHEYFFNSDRSIEYLKLAGIKVLRDQCVIIDNRLLLAGRDDAHNRNRKPVELLLSESGSGLPVILMDHQPVDLEGSVKNRVNLHISGHTHGGQIFPGNFFASLRWKLPYGYRKIGSSHFYVSSGLGFSYIPMRLGTRSEIVRIHLKLQN